MENWGERMTCSDLVPSCGHGSRWGQRSEWVDCVLRTTSISLSKVGAWIGVEASALKDQKEKVERREWLAAVA